VARSSWISSQSLARSLEDDESLPLSSLSELPSKSTWRLVFASLVTSSSPWCEMGCFDSECVSGISSSEKSQ
jgi:hypothetical protein